MNNKSTTLTLKSIERNKLIRYPVMLIVLVFGLLVIFKEAHHLKANDFIEYWSASRIYLAGGNPYSPDELLRMQQQGGLSIQQPTLMYNPPWTLPIVTLFGLFDRPVGQILWIFTQIGTLLFCSSQIWQFYGGQSKQRWVAWVVTFTFGPVVSAVLFQGQISPFILVGLVGFLIYIDKPGKAWLAGTFAVLASIKPQVPYLFFIVFFLWVLYNKKWTALIGFATFLILLNLIVLAFNPHIYNQYILCIRNNGPTAWATPTIGTYLRLLFNPTGYYLQFVPPLLGAVGSVIYWIKYHEEWSWKDELPLLLFVSVITSAYSWTYDQVVLLFPVLIVFIWLLQKKKNYISVFIIVTYITFDLLYIRIHLIRDDVIFIWFAPTIFIWYLFFKYILHRPERIQVRPNLY